MAAALATSKSSSSSRRAARMPTPLPSPALPSPGASIPQPAPLPAYATGRIATERHIPVYTPQPGETESLEHAIDAKPAYQPDLDARRQVEEERRQYLAALARRRFDEEIAAAWAAAPIVLWGGMTLAGCVLRLAFGAATVVLVVTAIGAALPFVCGRRYLPLGVACGVLVALAGTWILEGIGGILVPNAWRALDRSGMALDLQQVESRVNALAQARSAAHPTPARLVGLEIAVTPSAVANILRHAVAHDLQYPRGSGDAAHDGRRRPDPAANDWPRLEDEGYGQTRRGIGETIDCGASPRNDVGVPRHERTLAAVASARAADRLGPRLGFAIAASAAGCIWVFSQPGGGGSRADGLASAKDAGSDSARI